MIYSSYLLIFRKTPYIFLDNINLLIHEAGHLIFSPFGNFISTIGGTINQLLIPSLFAIYFLSKRDIFALSFSIFWIGENLINISYYIADAKLQALPLIGAGTHDWLKILTKLNFLDKAEFLGNTLFYTGSTIIIISLLLAISSITKSIASTPK
jgi:hypothetical protein